MDPIREHIKNQLTYNDGKNLLRLDFGSDFSFIDGTDSMVERLAGVKPEEIEMLIDFAAAKAIEAFCSINQYYSFDSKAKNELKEIYRRLFEWLLEKPTDLTLTAGLHYRNLRNWLLKTNPFAEKLYSDNAPKIERVPCSEYSAESQMGLLGIDPVDMLEPVLDIGCGASMNLVQHLESLGLEVLGIDRLVKDSAVSQKADWLEFDYGTERWGTILSNLGFSNHFHHHHLRIDGNFLAYAEKYMQILRSLKPVGRFYYAPDLPFIEQYLDRNNFSLSYHRIPGTDYRGVVLEREKR